MSTTRLKMKILLKTKPKRVCVLSTNTGGINGEILNVFLRIYIHTNVRTNSVQSISPNANSLCGALVRRRRDHAGITFF